MGIDWEVNKIWRRNVGEAFDEIFDDKNSMRALGRIGLHTDYKPSEEVFSKNKEESTLEENLENKTLRDVSNDALQDLGEKKTYTFIGAVRGWNNSRIADGLDISEGYAASIKSNLKNEGFLEKEGGTRYAEWFPGSEVLNTTDESQSNTSISDSSTTDKRNVIDGVERVKETVESVEGFTKDKVVAALEDLGEVKQSDLVNALDVSNAAVSNAVSDLDDQGVLDKQRSGIGNTLKYNLGSSNEIAQHQESDQAEDETYGFSEVDLFEAFPYDALLEFDLSDRDVETSDERELSDEELVNRLVDGREEYTEQDLEKALNWGPARISEVISEMVNDGDLERARMNGKNFLRLTNGHSIDERNLEKQIQDSKTEGGHDKEYTLNLPKIDEDYFEVFVRTAAGQKLDEIEENTAMHSEEILSYRDDLKPLLEKNDGDYTVHFEASELGEELMAPIIGSWYTSLISNINSDEVRGKEEYDQKKSADDTKDIDPEIERARMYIVQEDWTVNQSDFADEFGLSDEEVGNLIGNMRDHYPVKRRSINDDFRIELKGGAIEKGAKEDLTKGKLWRAVRTGHISGDELSTDRLRLSPSETNNYDHVVDAMERKLGQTDNGKLGYDELTSLVNDEYPVGDGDMAFAAARAMKDPDVDIEFKDEYVELNDKNTIGWNDVEG